MECTIKYLWKAASLLPSGDHTHLKIRSNLLNNALTSSQYNYKYNIGATGSHIRCQYCHTEWKHNKYSHKILKNKRIKKRLKRKYKLIAENIANPKNEKELKKSKERLYGKVISIKCSLCDKITKQTVMKDGYKAQPNQINNTTTLKINQSLNVSGKTPNNKPFLSKKSQKVNSVQSQTKKRKLQELCYQTSTTKPTTSSTPNQNTTSNNKANTSTPQGNSKKRKQRDKFAGLFREACIASSTPKHKSDLQKLLKERDS